MRPGGARRALELPLVALLAAGCLAACDMPIGAPAPDAPAEGRNVATTQVIVRLRFDAPEGASPDSDAYRAALVAVRDAFLGQLGGIEHRVVRTYDTIPLVVLAIAPADRAAVEKLPSVASVENDRLNAPLAQ